MGRTLEEIMRALPAERRAKAEARTRALSEEVEGLKALRRLAARSQSEIAAALGIKQPSVHKIEGQADLYLSTLRRFVQAAGGNLHLVVELPGRPPLRLLGLGDLQAPAVDAGEAPSPLSRVAEERGAFAGAESGAEAVGAAGVRKKAARRRGRWHRPRVSRMKAGEAELGRGEPASMAS